MGLYVPVHCAARDWLHPLGSGRMWLRVGNPGLGRVEPQLRGKLWRSLVISYPEREQRDPQVLGQPCPTPRTTPKPVGLTSTLRFSPGKRDATAAPSPGRSRSASSPAAPLQEAPGPDHIPPPLHFYLLQVRNLSNVNLKDVTGALPTAATARSTCTCTPRTSPISAKCATSPTRTLAPCEST